MGKEIQCRLGKDRVAVGTSLLLHELGIKVTLQNREIKEGIEKQGKTVVNVAINDRLCALIAIADTPKVRQRSGSP